MITLMEWMEDFDNRELSEYDLQEQLREAVEDYNSEHDTHHDPQRSVIKYFRWVKDKYQPEM